MQLSWWLWVPPTQPTQAGTSVVASTWSHWCRVPSPSAASDVNLIAHKYTNTKFHSTKIHNDLSCTKILKLNWVIPRKICRSKYSEDIFLSDFLQSTDQPSKNAILGPKRVYKKSEFFSQISTRNLLKIHERYFFGVNNEFRKRFGRSSHQQIFTVAKLKLLVPGGHLPDENDKCARWRPERNDTYF